MKKRVWARLVCVMVSVMLVFSMTSGISAAELRKSDILGGNNTITPFYVYINSTTTSLSISSGSANMYANLTGVSGVTTKVSITMTLQKKTASGGWTNVVSYSDTFYKSSGSLSKSYSVSRGTYRVKASYTAYKGSSSEPVTKYSAEKTY